jgi:hypothetical protein
VATRSIRRTTEPIPKGVPVPTSPVLPTQLDDDPASALEASAWAAAALIATLDAAADRVRELTAGCARALGRPGDTEPLLWLLPRLEAANDPRRDQYFRLLAVINSWPPRSL